MTDLAPSGQRVRSPATWAAARADYAAGLSAPEVCERHDLGLSAFRTRARNEGWRRCDEPDPEPLDLEDGEDADEDLPPACPGDMAALAWRRLARAVRAGRVVEAWRWARLHRELRAFAAQKAAAARAAEPPVVSPNDQALIDQFAAIKAQSEAELRRLLGDDPALPGRDDLHDVHDLHAESSTSAPPRPLNRAERRKRERLAAWKARQADAQGAAKGVASDG